MRKWCFLRGYVPTDRDYKEIIHSSIDSDTDMWIRLFNRLLGKDDYGEVYYINSGIKYEKQYSDHFKINWVRSASNVDDDFDVIFCRGGYPEYPEAIMQCSDAFKIYYGAGRRWLPNDGIKYDLVIVDSYQQKQEALKKFKYVYLWNKPSPEGQFCYKESQKVFDVCYIANAQQAKIKGYQWVKDTFPNNLCLLHLGFKESYGKKIDLLNSFRCLHHEMPARIRQCKIAIFPYWNSTDSAPRGISECLACGVPVVVSNTIPTASSVFVTKATSFNFWNAVEDEMDAWNPDTSVRVRMEYDKNFSLEKATAEILAYVK